MTRSHKPLAATALLVLIHITCWSSCHTFSCRTTLQVYKHSTFHYDSPHRLFLAESSSSENDEQETIVVNVAVEKLDSSAPMNALPPSDRTVENLPLDSYEDVQDIPSSSSSSSSSSSVALIMTNDMKRILIEELGYKRRDVEQMRVELASPIISKRLKCPSEGMPSEWKMRDDGMLQKLENESKYPLRGPLLGVSLVLTGKGLSDALITLIKVQQGFKGASLAEEFMGIPVLGIDAFCVIVGVGLAWWTWNTMRDD
uniref:Uncharacterized protein n=1 Tax=Attheya septentrionalis TaxID=420275 RepID=A0A7S2U678_9STRA|mmetsp:Transcript_12275/g.22270  ORF Transcript_12275/g.22270 Transcript_12275/m.22270 type:complete len:257 (+) Transcript_12275:60-830(+)